MVAIVAARRCSCSQNPNKGENVFDQGERRMSRVHEQRKRTRRKVDDNVLLHNLPSRRFLASMAMVISIPKIFVLVFNLAFPGPYQWTINGAALQIVS